VDIPGSGIQSLTDTEEKISQRYPETNSNANVMGTENHSLAITSPPDLFSLVASDFANLRI